MDTSLLQSSYELWTTYLPVLINVALVILVAWITSSMLHLASRRIRRRLQGEDTAADISGRAARLLTLTALFEHVARTLIIILALVTILGAFGINLAPIITGLGVVGLAVSLGAQSLIKDYFGGIMILLENQYTVGDTVTIGPVSGSVERLTLRLTTLRDVNGKLHIIPNGDVRIVTNSSRDWALAIVDLNLALDTNLDRALGLLTEATQRASGDAILSAALREPPQVQGWHQLLDWAVQVRISARTPPSRKVEVEMALRRLALDALQHGGVSLARPVMFDERT